MDFVYAQHLLADSPPAEIEILETGKFKTKAKGEFEITESTLDELVDEFNTAGAAGKRQIDIDHNAAYKGDTRAAGWIQGLRREGSKLKATVKWNALGQQLISDEIYKFTSAEFLNRVEDKTTGVVSSRRRLKGATLTNRPFVETLAPVALSDGEIAELDEQGAGGQAGVLRLADALGIDPGDALILATGTIGGTKLGSLPSSSYGWVDADGKGHLPYKDASGKVDAAHTRNALARLNQVKGMPSSAKAKVRRKLEAALESVGGHPGGTTTTSENQNGDQRMSDALRSALELSEDADEATVLAAVEALKAKPAPQVDTSQYVTLADFVGVKERAESLEKRLHDTERARFFDGVERQGKITAAERPDFEAFWDADPERVAKMLSERKPVVDLRVVGHEGSGNPNAEGASVLATAEDPERRGLQALTEQILSENKGMSIGDAQVLAERQLKAGAA